MSKAQSLNGQYMKETLIRAYRLFNNRNIDALLGIMQKDVEWPNAMEGGIEQGHDAVRMYWTRQWAQIDPHVEPVAFNNENDGRINVTVHQVVKDLAGNLIVDQKVHHIYTFDDGLIKNMEIKNYSSLAMDDSEP